MSSSPHSAHAIPCHSPGTAPISQDRAIALLRSGSLQMQYQPILDVGTRRVLKVEALARLHDGERLVPPGEFLPHFEAEDLLELYILGLDQALRERRDWLDMGRSIDLAINIAPGALEDPRYFDATLKALARHECEPRSLTLEILESEALTRTGATLEQFQRYRALGVRMAEDDLGCGHSSLVRLRQLPFDCIKIDRNIVSMDATDDVDVLHFVYQLTRLGHALGKSVIVEGVDRADLIEAIGILGADAVQGYAIAAPMPGEQFVEWMARRPDVPADARPETPLGKIARLVVAEERLHAGGQGITVADRLQDAFGDCDLLAAFRDEVMSIFRDSIGASPELNALLKAAASDGVRTETYRAARRHLAAAATNRSAGRAMDL